MDRFDRIFELNRIFQSARRPVSRRLLEEKLACSKATVKRSIEDMRLYLNAPIQYSRSQNGYYYDRAGGEMFELPGLWFNSSELYALLSAQQLLENVQPGLLRSHLQPLQKRIGSLLKQQHAAGSDLLNSVSIQQMAARPAGDCFAAVTSALAKKYRLQIQHYNRAQNEHISRIISPLRLLWYRDNWYVDAWCHLRKGLRTFSLDAIESAQLLAQKARRVAKKEMLAHFSSAYGIFSGQATATAVLRFAEQSARWVSVEQWHPQQQGFFLPDGRYELHLPYHNPTELLMDIMKYADAVEVVSPPILREQTRQRLARALAQYK